MNDVNLSSLDAQPDEYRRGAEPWVRRAIGHLMEAGHPLYASITKQSMHDLVENAGERTPPAHSADANAVSTPPETSSLAYREIDARVEWVVNIDEALSFDIGAFLATLSSAADGFADQIERGILSHISDITEVAGNVTSAQGRDLADAFLDAMEHMTFSFDEIGQPSLTVVMSPQQIQKMKDMKLTPEQKARHAEILHRKREEWNATQRRRELPGFGD